MNSSNKTKKLAEQKNKSPIENNRSDGNRVNTGSSDSTIPERATDKHTETSPRPKK